MISTSGKRLYLSIATSKKSYDENEPHKSLSTCCHGPSGSYNIFNGSIDYSGRCVLA